MKILYLSNHIGDADFNLLVKNVKRKPNPAGQNFHGKIIQALSLCHDVTCLSLVPSAEEGFKRKIGIKGDGTPHYYFYPAKRAILPNALTLPSKIMKTVKEKIKDIEEDEFIIVYDTLNIALSKTAKKLSKKYHLKRIAVCTDDPYNISETREGYIDAVLRYSKDADGYFCLTKGLNELFNTNYKPYKIHLGIVEKPAKNELNVEKPYIYYGGALYYKDGTDALLEAFKNANPNCMLLLSGHGPSKAKAVEMGKTDERILYLGQISKQDNYAYQENASLVINPRLYRGYLDKVSVPSKVLEYLANAPYVASTLSSPIKEQFEEDINWIDIDPAKAIDNLTDFFKSHLDQKGNLIGLKKNGAKEKILAEYGLEATGKVFSSLIEEVSEAR